MWQKNAAEMEIDPTKAMTAIMQEDRETGRRGEERRHRFSVGIGAYSRQVLGAENVNPSILTEQWR
ncbi:MAG TPA: hypothetical protein VJ810_35730 [Blastocatellia bacterium]|nr:hypothetical protein [Blastocatellia bacterium]